MGYVSPFDVVIAISAFEMALKEAGYNFNLGVGVAAVQNRIARSI
jgi:aspartate aminotransferase-like enzyme